MQGVQGSVLAGSNANDVAIEHTVGLHSTIPAGGARHHVTSSAMTRRFRGNRLTVTQAPDDAVIRCVRAGGVPSPQFVPVMKSGAAPPANAFDKALALDSIGPGEHIVIEVESRKGGVFSALMTGLMWDDVRAKEPLEECAAEALRFIDERYEPGVTLEELQAWMSGSDR